MLDENAKNEQNIEQNIEPRRPLILLVEDEPIQRKVLTKLVENAGYNVMAAEDGLKGLQLARKYLPELVLSDALLPHMDGRALCYALKSDPLTSHIKVLIATSLYTKPRYRNEAYQQYRVDGWFIKPVNENLLKGLLKEFVGEPTEMLMEEVTI
jgi:CheY-like chemotaxis protein